VAARSASYKFPDLSTFLKVYEESISKNSLLFKGGDIDSDVAQTFKLDLIIPVLGRQGPFEAQVVHRGADGSIGVHLPDIPASAQQAFRQLFHFIGEVRDYMIQSGQYVPQQELNDALAKLASTEAQVAAGGGGEIEPRRRASRGFPIPDVSAQPVAISGKMADRSLRDAMVNFAIEKSTGLLNIKYPDGTTRYGYWDSGGPVGWRTEPLNEDEVLGALLFRAGQLTKEQVQESLAIMKSEKCRQGEALVQMRVMTFSQLIMVLGKQNEFVLQQVMSDRQGDWEFHLLPQLPEQFLAPPLKVPSLLFRALYSHAREMNPAQIAELMEPNLDRYLSFDVEARDVVGELKLQKKEVGFIDVINSNSWRLREVFSVSPLSRSHTSSFVWALDELGLLIMKDQEDESRRMARIVDRISRKKDHIRGTYFDILEVHWVCLKAEVQEAHERLKVEFQGESFSGLDASLEEAVAMINTHLDEAFTTLESDSSRRRYRQEVIEKDAIINSADMLARQGEMAIMRKDRRAACGSFAKASELIPGESSYRDGLRRSTVI
jgi:hypothetical protein